MMQRGAYVRPDRVHLAFKEYMADGKLGPEALVEMLRGYATHYLWLYRPALVSDGRLRSELDCLYRLGVTTAFPLVLRLLDLHARGALPSDDLVGCLRDIQSFVIRRSIMRESTRGYGVLFPSVIRDLDEQNIAASLRSALAHRTWPSDEVFVPALLTFPLYRREAATARVILKRIEEAEEHKEPVDVGALIDNKKLQLEHILPQNLGDDDGGAWQLVLGADWQSAQATWVHTLGNLTLTGYNPTLSNHPFEIKRQEFARSHLVLNKGFASIAVWNADEIERRGKDLA